MRYHSRLYGDNRLSIRAQRVRITSAAKDGACRQEEY